MAFENGVADYACSLAEVITCRVHQRQRVKNTCSSDLSREDGASSRAFVNRQGAQLRLELDHSFSKVWQAIGETNTEKDFECLRMKATFQFEDIDFDTIIRSH